ncbi:hypothetical protein DFH09DRAFT_1387303 [Mycena vulgaris]|nr:hypothetical protein DFH09DRAFT_1387303 [Mycena vulgaris]
MENTFSRTFLNPNAEQMNLLSSDTDIKNDFQIVLEEGLDKEVHFASVERYAGENAPEPHLAVSGLRFNFPLTEPDAWVWEATSSEVHFNNPAWERWIRDVAGPTALRGLRADCQPEYVFRKLVVHETGSQLMKLVEVEPTQNSPPKIGNLVVLLPSLFAGGNLELRHDGQSKQIDQSNLLTSVVAAYSGVEQSLSAVSAGYRLSLLYDIVHRGVRPPTLADLERPKQKLRWIMSAWKEDLSGSAPQFLACLLQRKYFPSVTFDASSLIGDDGLLLSVLRPLAQELQFSLHLVHFEVNVTVHDSQTQGYDESFSSAWVEEESICMGEESFDSIVTDDGDVEDHQVVITKIHDLEGIPVNVEGLKIATRDLINGRNVTLNEPESESYGRRTKKYSHTGLLIWPESTAGLRVSVGDVYELACNALGGSVSATPTDKENHLVEKLIQWCSTAHQDPRLQQTAYLLRQCAERWCNFGIFFRAMGACGVDKNIALIGPEGLVSAYQAFEWRDFSYFCTIVVTSDPSNTNRWALIMHLSQMATAEGDLEVQRWCQGHQSDLLRSLDLESLVELIIWGGGEFLKDMQVVLSSSRRRALMANYSIYPQLMIQWPSEANLWGLFFQRLYQSRGQIPCVDPDSVSAVINHGVGGIVTRLPAFPRCTVDGQEQANLRAVLNVIYLCLETDQVALCASIAQKMWGSGDYSPQFPPWIYYVGIACDLEGYFEADPGRSVLAPTLSPFFENTVVSLLSPRGWPPDGPAFPYSLTRPVLAAVMKAAKRVGGAFFLRKLWSHQPEMLHHLSTDTLQELGRSVFTYLRPSDDLLAYTEYAALVNLVIDAAVDTFDINCEGNALCGG